MRPLMAILLFLTLNPAIGQDSQSHGIHLRWIPDGPSPMKLELNGFDLIEHLEEDALPNPGSVQLNYSVSQILHVKKEIFVNTCPPELRAAMNSNSRSLEQRFSASYSANLPPSLRGRWSSATFATVISLGLKLAEEVAEDGSARPVNRKVANIVYINGHRYGSWYPGRQLMIYSFDSIQPLLAEALERGEIVPDNTLRGMSARVFNSRRVLFI